MVSKHIRGVSKRSFHVAVLDEVAMQDNKMLDL